MICQAWYDFVAKYIKGIYIIVYLFIYREKCYFLFFYQLKLLQKSAATLLNKM